MAAKLDGKLVSATVRAALARRVQSASSDPPRLALIRVGEDPASQVYVAGKEKAAAEIGIASTTLVLSETTSEQELVARVREANGDRAVHGILVQLPLPPQIRPEAAAEAVDPAKDVDGLHPYNLGRLAQGRPALIPCTPLGVLMLLRYYRIPTAGARVCVLGRSQIVGRPAALLLGLKAEWADATVTSVHSRSRDLAAITREADILVAAIGSPRFVRADMVRPGAAVVDVGIHRWDDPARPGKSRLCGDVDAAQVEPVAGWLSPVPGGVGLMTVAMLLANTVEAWERARSGPGDPVWRTLLDLAADGSAGE